MSILARFLGRGTAGLVIEPMRRRDLDEVLRIEDRSYPRPWTRSLFEGELEQVRSGERCYLVAREEGRLVGYAGMMFVVADAHVTNIAVAPEQHRRGIATRLLAELSWRAVEHGCDAMTLEVRVSNTGARALYERFGFTAAGVRKNYYENTEDAIVMWCNELRSEQHLGLLRALGPEAGR